MATANDLGGRRVPSFPGAKSEETQTFVGPDGQTLEVVKSISKNALAILKRRGFKSETRHQREMEEEALKKIENLNTTASQKDETLEDGPAETEEPTTGSQEEETVGEDNDDEDTSHASRKEPAKRAASRRR